MFLPKPETSAGVAAQIATAQRNYFHGYTNFIAVGDSITDRSSFTITGWTGTPIGMDTSGWAAALEVLSGQRLRSVGKDTTWKTDRDHGYSGITADQFIAGTGWLGDTIPIDELEEKAPDCDVIIVHIGTNNVPDASSAATIAGYIQAIWERAVATGKPVIGTDILQRAASYSGWTSTYRDKVAAVNAILRASWKTYGLLSYRNWDDLVIKDSNGYADATEFPNDGLHPTQRIGFKLGKDLWDFFSHVVTAPRPTIPNIASTKWVTPNPYITGSVASGSSFLATSWNTNSMGTEGTNWTASKVVDADGTEWQRFTRLTANASTTVGLYARITSGLPAAGTECRATATVRFPSGQTINGFGLGVQQVNASTAWGDLYNHGSATATVSHLADGVEEALLLSEPFQVQSGATQLWIPVGIINTGSAQFDFRRAGIFLNA